MIDNIGALLRRERLARHWSQEGLCRGICAVSYLSKIEQGRVTPSEDVLRPLFARLGLPFEDEPALERAVRLLSEAEALLLRGDYTALRARLEEFSAARELLSRSRYAAKAELLAQLFRPGGKPLNERLEIGLDEHALAIQRLLQGRFEDALRLFPCAFLYTEVGAELADRGDYSSAIRYLERGHELAAQEDAVHLMFRCRLLLGNCYCNLHRLEEMRRQYALAERLGGILGEDEAVESTRYNTAAVELECGDVTRAYTYFSALRSHTQMSLHKLAICCEKLGRREEALAAIERALRCDADYPPEPLASELCRLVSYRLTHGDYLHDAQYGAQLLTAFRKMRRELTAGFVLFRLPYVLEWYTANRCYRDAFELLRDFPEYRA